MWVGAVLLSALYWFWHMHYVQQAYCRKYLLPKLHKHSSGPFWDRKSFAFGIYISFLKNAVH